MPTPFLGKLCSVVNNSLPILFNKSFTVMSVSASTSLPAIAAQLFGRRSCKTLATV